MLAQARCGPLDFVPPWPTLVVRKRANRSRVGGDRGGRGTGVQVSGPGRMSGTRRFPAGATLAVWLSRFPWAHGMLMRTTVCP